MKPKTDLPKRPEQKLTKVLQKSKQAKVLVEESADELSTVNSALKQGLLASAEPPSVETVLERSLSAENKVQEASEKLAEVNRALAAEVREREMLEYRLAAVTEQEIASRHAALHDPLTGLPNRALFDDRLENALAQARRHQRNLAVMFLDLDQFKVINDSHGHDAGDSVLQTIAKRLKESTRSNDSISRFGGDEFLYLLMDASDRQDVGLVAAKMIEAIEAPCMVAVADGAIRVSVKASIGIAIFPGNGDTAEILLKSADSAMYEAKQSGSGFIFAG